MEKQMLDMLVKMNDRLSGIENAVSNLQFSSSETSNKLAGLNHSVNSLQLSSAETNNKLNDLDNSVGSLQLSSEETSNKLSRLEETANRIEETVNRIETTQTEDVVALLKVTKKKTDFEFEYLNNRVTQMDKKLFHLEKRIEN